METSEFLEYTRCLKKMQPREMVDLARSKHKILFRSVEKSTSLEDYLDVSTQLALRGFEDFGGHRHVSMGNFYELITQAFFGGKVGNDLMIKDKRGKLTRGTKEFEKSVLELSLEDSQERKEEECHARPDIINGKKQLIVESKSCKLGSHCNLLDGQLERYKNLQYTHPSSKTLFAIYRHSFDKIKSFRGTEDELFSSLAKNTHYALVLPLSFIMGLHDSYKFIEEEAKRKVLVRRHEPKGDKGKGKLYTSRGYFPPCTCINSATFDTLYLDPKTLMADIGVDSKGYTAYRTLSPRGFKVGEYTLKQFPILTLKDKNHKAWVEKFREDFSKGFKDVPF